MPAPKPAIKNTRRVGDVRLTFLSPRARGCFNTPLRVASTARPAFTNRRHGLAKIATRIHHRELRVLEPYRIETG